VKQADEPRAGEGPQVGLADIARLAGVGPAAVSNWRRRHESFPRPAAGTERSPRFLLSEVEAWLRSQGKPIRLGSKEHAWHLLDAARNVIDPVELLTDAGRLLLRGRDEVPDPLAGQGLAPSPGHPAAPSSIVTELVGHLDGDGASEVFEALSHRAAEGRNRPGTGATSQDLAAVLVDLAGPDRGAVLDPACGAGTLLGVAAERGFGPVLGQELDPALARLAAVRLALRGIPGRIDAGDSFGEPQQWPQVPSAVLCHPPFAERSWGQESHVGDPRFDYGLPARGESELAWAQISLSAVAEGGTAVVVMPPAAAARPAGRRIRRELVARGALAAVLALPPGLAAHYAHALQIWVLRHRQTWAGRSGASGVVMADAGEAGADWAAVRALAAQVSAAVYGAVDGGGANVPVGDGMAMRQVPALEILDEVVDLTPRRYLAGPGPEHMSPAALVARCANVREQWGAVGKEFDDLCLAISGPSVTDGSRGNQPPVPVLSIDDLIRSGSLALRRRPPRGAQSSEVTTAPLVTGMDVALGRGPSEVGEVDADALRTPPIREGDVLVPTIATKLRARVAWPADVGSHPGQGLIVLRPDPTIIDPAYLAGYLSSTQAGRQADRVGSSLGGALKVDPRRLAIPVPPLEVQRRWGEAFERLEQTRQRMRDAATHAEDALRAFGDAMAVGIAEDAHAALGP
jgi:predicted DNA-binding transcriptional regulator AlpA